MLYLVLVLFWCYYHSTMVLLLCYYHTALVLLLCVILVLLSSYHGGTVADCPGATGVWCYKLTLDWYLYVELSDQQMIPLLNFA